MADGEPPLYGRILAELKDRVIRGVYPVSTLMPTETALAEEFDTSRSTVRIALKELQDKGFVFRRQGMGTRVISAAPQTAFAQSFRSLEELFQVAVETYFNVHDARLVSIDAEIAERIGGKPGEAWYQLDGVRWDRPGGHPICYVQCFIPTRFEDAIAFLTTYQGPFFAALEQRSGQEISEAVQEIRAARASPEMERSLGLRPGAWALQLLRKYYVPSGLLIASFNWHPAEQMTYKMTINRARGIVHDQE